MLMIYRAGIRANFDYRYGCLAYGSAAKSTLAKLDVVQTRASRLCIGAIQTTPISALHVEAGEAPLRLQHEKLAQNYWIKLKGFVTALPSISLLTECCEFIDGSCRINRGILSVL